MQCTQEIIAGRYASKEHRPLLEAITLSKAATEAFGEFTTRVSMEADKYDVGKHSNKDYFYIYKPADLGGKIPISAIEDEIDILIADTENVAKTNTDKYDEFYKNTTIFFNIKDDYIIVKNFDDIETLFVSFLMYKKYGPVAPGQDYEKSYEEVIKMAMNENYRFMDSLASLYVSPSNKSKKRRR